MTQATCVHCGNPHDRGPCAKYCNDRCKDSAKRERRREVVACKHCSTPFERAKGTRPQVYCTPTCANAATGDRLRKPQQCIDCRRPAAYVHHRWRDRCSRCEHRQRNQPKPQPPRTWYCGTCRHCGESFCDLQPHRNFCSKRCAHAHHNHESRTRRRARARKADGDPLVYRAATFQRDGWRCQLCGRKVKRDAIVPHPLAPTLDHIIPLAAGGKHVPENVQLAHFICNARKSAGGSQQLRLIA